MTAQTLSRVTLKTLENCRVAATQAVVAYRLGGHRLLGAVDGALQNKVYPRTAKVAPKATARLDTVRGNVSQIVVKGIDLMAERTEQVITLGANTAAEQLGKVAAFAAGIDNPLLANGLQAAARLTMPGAQLALVVSGKVGAGAKALADAAGARPVRKVVRRAAAGAKRQSKAVVGAGRKRVAKAVQAPVAQARRASRAAKQAVAA